MDATERIARWLAEIEAPQEVDIRWPLYRGKAAALKGKFAARGIPIAALLDGSAKAVDAAWLEKLRALTGHGPPSRVCEVMTQEEIAAAKAKFGPFDPDQYLAQPEQTVEEMAKVDPEDMRRPVDDISQRRRVAMLDGELSENLVVPKDE